MEAQPDYTTVNLLNFAKKNAEIILEPIVGHDQNLSIFNFNIFLLFLCNDCITSTFTIYLKHFKREVV